MPEFFDNDDLPFEFRKKEISKELQPNNWKKVDDAIQKTEVPVRKMNWLKPLLAAASVLAIIATVYWFAQRNPAAPQIAEVKTGYGEVKHITLPDSSIVVLNANSSMRIPEQWSTEGNREVWVDGEAYFHVTKKLQTHQRFIVHTSEVDIEVLGTKFNVNTRRSQAVVALEEGKIQLTVNGEVKKVMEKAPIIMKPGEVATVKKDNHMVKLNEDTAVIYHSGWSRNEFHFSNTPFADVSRIIDETYGYKVVVGDTLLLQKQISGDLRADNIQEFVKVLEIVIKAKMRIENKTIIVSSPGK